MKVRRVLSGWLARITTRVRFDSVGGERALATASARHVKVAQQAPAARLANWLDEGRSLRRHATPARVAEGGRYSVPEVASSLALESQSQRAISGPVRQDINEDARIPQLVSQPPVVPAPPTAQIQADLLSQFTAASLDAVEQMDESQRRLVFLGYLVRQGIYNEGFEAERLPHQYWRSRGVDDPASATPADE